MQKEEHGTPVETQQPAADTESDKETPPVEETTTTTTTTEEPPIEAPVKDAEMPSFDEWKQKMLKEQAEQEKYKQMEGM